MKFLFSVSNGKRRDGFKKEVSRLLDVGLLDIPISPIPEQLVPSSVSLPNTPSVSSPFSDTVPPTVHSYAATVVPPPAKTMMHVRSRRFKELGLNRGSRKILKKQYSSRTITQYSGAWSRFSAYVIKEGIPKAEVSESTVINFLSSRLRNPAKKEKGKVAPLTLKYELYGLLSSLWATYGIEISTTSPHFAYQDVSFFSGELAL